MLFSPTCYLPIHIGEGPFNHQGPGRQHPTQEILLSAGVINKLMYSTENAD